MVLHLYDLPLLILIGVAVFSRKPKTAPQVAKPDHPQSNLSIVEDKALVMPCKAAIDKFIDNLIITIAVLMIWFRYVSHYTEIFANSVATISITKKLEVDSKIGIEIHITHQKTRATPVESP